MRIHRQPPPRPYLHEARGAAMGAGLGAGLGLIGQAAPPAAWLLGGALVGHALGWQAGIRVAPHSDPGHFAITSAGAMLGIGLGTALAIAAPAHPVLGFLSSSLPVLTLVGGALGTWIGHLQASEGR